MCPVSLYRKCDMVPQDVILVQFGLARDGSSVFVSPIGYAFGMASQCRCAVGCTDFTI